MTSQLGNYGTARIYHHVRMSVSSMLFAKIQRLPLGEIADGSIGELLSRTTSDADAFAQLVCYVLAPVLQAIVVVVVALAFMLHASPLLAVCSLAFVPFWIALLSRSDRRLDAIRDEIFKVGDRLKLDLTEALAFTGLLRSKSYGAQEFELRRFEALNVLNCSLNLLWFRATVFKSLGLSLSAGVFGHIVTLVVGAFLVAQGRIDVGTLVAFLVLLGRLYGPVQTLAYAGISVRASLTAVDRVSELLARDEEVDGAVQPSSGSYELRGLTAAFDDRVIFENVCLEIGRGEWVLLGGENGTGKTTIARMLPRLFKPQVGRITYSGVELSELRLSDLRSHSIMLSQHDSLFTGTVRENICYGYQCSDELVWSVLDDVEMTDRIRSDPSGLDAVVLPLGTALSSGERQRLALARALLRRPEVLIIDEATSNIDSESERRILQAIRRRLNCTMVFITHRVIDLEMFGHVVVLEPGGVPTISKGFARSARSVVDD